MKELRYTDDESLPELVRALADLKREGSYWDFKREWHGNKAELLHDIICMANNPAGETGIIAIGIDEEKDFLPTGSAELLGKRLNTQNLTDMLRSKHWADGMPQVRVAPIGFGGSTVDVLLISHDDETVPYYLTRDYPEGKKTVRAGVVYSRDADSNTPLNGSATALAVEKLWRRHFGLDKTPLERLPQLLKEPEKWRQTLPVLARDEEDCGYCYCHEDFPEFTYVRRPQEETDGIEYFMLASPFFERPDWWTGYFYYHQTMICRIEGAYSDHLWIPAPRIAALREDETLPASVDTHFYAYYLDGSLERIAMLFELDESKEGASAYEEVGLLDELVPTFRDECERACFEKWLVGDWPSFLSRCEKQIAIRHVPQKLWRTEGQYDKVERHARESATLVEMLKKFRSLEQG